MIRILILMAVLTPGISAAGDVDIYLGQWSKHYLDSEDYNESHGLIGVRYKRFVAYSFENSYHDEAYAVGYEFWTRKRGALHYGARGGYVHGYDEFNVFVIGYASYKILEFNIHPAFVSVGFKFNLSYE